MSKKDEKTIEEKLEDDAVSAESSVEPKENDELGKLKQKLEEADNSFRRALADYQNLQKRFNEERRSLILASNRDLILRILSVLDTLELANKHDESEGLKVSIGQFLDVLKSEGVIQIETVGKEFDPGRMEAIAIEEIDPSTGSGQGGKVLEEIRPGYILNDKLLRAAQVKVGKE